MTTPQKIDRAVRKALKNQAARLVYRTIAPNRFTVWVPQEFYRRWNSLIPELERELAGKTAKAAGRLGMHHITGGFRVKLTPDPAPKSRGVRVEAIFAQAQEEPARLVALEGLDGGLVYPLVKPDTLIGRGEADLCLPQEARGVSRRHALLSARGAEFVLKDLGSGTGTFVNEYPVESQALAAGDLIYIGSVVLGFETGFAGGGQNA